jgi:hypothetical protein
MDCFAGGPEQYCGGEALALAGDEKGSLLPKEEREELKARPAAGTQPEISVRAREGG